MFTINKSLIAIFLFLSFWHGSIQAQDVKLFLDKAPSAEEIATILFSPATDVISDNKPVGMKMRSISFGKVKAVKTKEIKTANASQNKTSVGLPIKFSYNSAEILPESKPFLNEVGKMLTMVSYSDKRLVVEGHTDAVGSRNFNQYLSQKRAEAVKSYLKDNYSITNNRLIVRGMGENQPLKGVTPYASVNRRVQFYSVL